MKKTILFLTITALFLNFGCRKENSPPSEPRVTTPGNFSGGYKIGEIKLRWSCTDPDGDNLNFDVFFGTESPPELIASDISAFEYIANIESHGEYYWKVVAKDNKGSSVSGKEWEFSTVENKHPDLPILIFLDFLIRSEVIMLR